MRGLPRFISIKGKGTKRVLSLRGRKKRSLRRRLVTRLTLIAAVAAITGVGTWFFISGEGSVLSAQIREEAIIKSARMGFTINNILVDGRTNADASSLLALLAVEKGDPLFSFNPDMAKTKIEQMSWIEKAHVERRFPDTIFIRLIERKPLALWQKKDGVVLIDAQGAILSDKNLQHFSGLVMVSGEGAPLQAASLVQMLGKAPQVKERVDVAHWVENRRWNLRLKDEKLVILPEKDAAGALHRLAEKHRDEAILDKTMTSIDVRDPSRFIVETQRGKVQEYNADPAAAAIQANL